MKAQSTQCEKLLQENWSSNNNVQMHQPGTAIDMSKRESSENGQYFNHASRSSTVSSFTVPKGYHSQQNLSCCQHRLASCSESAAYQTKLLFGKYTLCEIFCIILIALSALTILILLISWMQILPFRQSWPSQDDPKNQKMPIIMLSDKKIEQTINSYTNTPKLVLPLYTKPDKKSVYYSFGSNLDELVIKSPNDFKDLGNRTKTLKIESLKINDFTYINNLPLDEMNIENLEFLGPITPKWLEKIIDQLSNNVKYLRVDIDATCALFSEHSSTKYFPMSSETLLKLESIFMENSANCKILEWPVELKASKLKSFTASDTILNENNLSSLKEFLGLSEETLEEIIITDSYICEKCDLSDLHFEHISTFKVLKPRDTIEKVLR